MVLAYNVRWLIPVHQCRRLCLRNIRAVAIRENGLSQMMPNILCMSTKRHAMMRVVLLYMHKVSYIKLVFLFLFMFVYGLRSAVSLPFQVLYTLWMCRGHMWMCLMVGYDRLSGILRRVLFYIVSKMITMRYLISFVCAKHNSFHIPVRYCGYYHNGFFVLLSFFCYFTLRGYSYVFLSFSG